MARIGLIYDLFEDYPWKPGEPVDADAEYEPPETVDALEQALITLGHTAVRVGTAYDLLRKLDGLRLDAAVNITEAAHSRNREAYALVLLEMAGIPAVGSDALTMSLSLDKAWTKDLAVAAGVRTPSYRVYGSGDAVDADDLPGRFPLFVKPRYEGSSKGITESSRVESVDELIREVAWMTATYSQDAIVEVFLEGGEYTVGVIGNGPPEALPVLPRAVDVETGIGIHALEHRGMPERDIEYEVRGSLTPELEAALQRDAITIYEKLECLDFARIDFRLDSEDEPSFLEINPLPTFAPDGTFAIIAEMMNRSYNDFLAEILDRALRRVGVERPAGVMVTR